MHCRPMENTVVMLFNELFIVDKKFCGKTYFLEWNLHVSLGINPFKIVVNIEK